MRFVISGRRILTNSHVVDDSYDTYVQVRKHGSSTKYEAIVETVGFEYIPSIYEDVSVLGYPRGGDTICVTKGIVSRVESGEYMNSSIELLKILTDATIDYGNSGGPVVCGNKVVGVAFQGFPNLEKTVS
ncbi:hypothetical protein HID58_087763 [Brassica napus]|uniref:Uncharacterized protein n=1 Tax=Brassica napus TaxID=3708 RepID=A0ABQ7XU76_BRANA|nr:hypothetical protein HID58_087763 [Brassica napus]